MLPKRILGLHFQHLPFIKCGAGKVSLPARTKYNRLSYSKEEFKRSSRRCEVSLCPSSRVLVKEYHASEMGVVADEGGCVNL
jgi:hypothetical protein